MKLEFMTGVSTEKNDNGLIRFQISFWFESTKEFLEFQGIKAFMFLRDLDEALKLSFWEDFGIFVLKRSQDFCWCHEAVFYWKPFLKWTSVQTDEQKM